VHSGGLAEGFPQRHQREDVEDLLPGAVSSQAFDGAAITPEEIREHLSSAFAMCQLPEVLEIVSQIPQTSVGRFDMKVSRASYADVYGGATVQESGPRSVATKRKTVGHSN